ncbi:hypothetical protein HDU98_009995 [Podochytrium sp. JEL0797]|nr:hypothetical protein HDU98_009995 [Podochytrium sp. JEL0797]
MIVAPKTTQLQQQKPRTPTYTSTRAPTASTSSSFVPRTLHLSSHVPISGTTRGPRSQSAVPSSSSFVPSYSYGSPSTVNTATYVTPQPRPRSYSNSPGIKITTTPTPIPRVRPPSTTSTTPQSVYSPTSAYQSYYHAYHLQQQHQQQPQLRPTPHLTDFQTLTIHQPSTLPSPHPQDRNTYHLDGTRAHPAHPPPMTPLDEMLDNVYLPFREEPDANVYNMYDGTRVHPPVVPDAIEFAREFAAWDRCHAYEMNLRYGSGAATSPRPRGPRLNPFAREFVPGYGTVQSATCARTFAEMEAQQEGVRKRAYSAGGGRGEIGELKRAAERFRKM